MNIGIDERKPESVFRILLLAVCLVLPGLLPSCVSMDISSPRKDGQVILQNPAAKCQVVESFGQYFLLFGAAPVRTIPAARMFPKPDKSYRITQELKWHDMLLTIFGGAFLSLTKNTVTIEECEAAAVFATQTERNAFFAREAEATAQKEQKEIDARIIRFAKTHSKSVDTILHLKDDTTVGGLIKSISDETIVLEVVAEMSAAKTDETKSSDKKLLDKKSNAGKSTREISRRDIVKIQFQDRK